MDTKENEKKREEPKSVLSGHKQYQNFLQKRSDETVLIFFNLPVAIMRDTSRLFLLSTLIRCGSTLATLLSGEAPSICGILCFVADKQ